MTDVSQRSNFTQSKSIALTILVVALLLIGNASPAQDWVQGELAVSVIDVGQGDSILIQFPQGQVMLIDAGESYAGEDVRDYLLARGIEDIEYLVASHPHTDHIRGMFDIFPAFPIGEVWDSGYDHGTVTQGNFLGEISTRQIDYYVLSTGYSETIDGVEVTVMLPGEELLGGSDACNNNSLVLYMVYNDVSFLFTGDMEENERELIDPWPETTILKIAHHGSYNGTDTDFLDDTTPEVAIISHAYYNSYDHPHEEAVEDLVDEGCDIYSTAIDGTVVVCTDGNTYDVFRLDPDSCNYYIGNRTSKKFHRPSCSYLPKYWRRVIFGTRYEAIADDYTMCSYCKP